MARRALIVGAGIGGLSAAIALRTAGWDVRIFERSASLRELGFGLGLAPNAMAALDELGVGETVLARACEPVAEKCAAWTAPFSNAHRYHAASSAARSSSP